MNAFERDMIATMTGMANYVEPPIRPPWKQHGGKSYLARRIIPRLKRKKRYVEPFGGAGSVLLNLEKSCYEHYIYADTHPMKVAVMRLLKDGLVTNLPPYTRESFDQADDTTPIGWLVKCRMSRGGLGKDFAWSDRERGGQPGDVNAWQTFIASLSIYQTALAKATILNTSAFNILPFCTSDDMVYLDPPYYPGTRSTFGEYGPHELTNQAHKTLIAQARGTSASVAISGYRCERYDEWLKDWRREDWDVPNNSGQTAVKERRVESLWRNYT